VHSHLVDLMVDGTPTPAFQGFAHLERQGTTAAKEQDAEAESVRAIVFGWQNQHDKSTPCFHY